MDHSETVELTKQVLACAFKDLGKTNKVAVREINLVFQLSNKKPFKCSCQGQEIEMGKYVKSVLGLMKGCFAIGHINGFIQSALKRLATENNISFGAVNIVMSMPEENNFSLILRSAIEAKKEIEVEDLIK